MHSVTIPAALNGPPTSGHGGASAGLIAEASALQFPVVSLLAPPPLEVQLMPAVVEGGVEYCAGARPIARVTSGEALPDVAFPWLDPAVVGRAVAEMRRRLEPEHPFPTCFGCGHARPDGDGLELVAGPIPDSDLFATTWRPAGTPGTVPTWRVWAAMDCPTGHACLPQITEDEAIVLGRFTVQVRLPIPADAVHQIVVRATPRDGRRIRSSAAVVDAEGRNLAVADAVWVTIPR